MDTIKKILLTGFIVLCAFGLFGCDNIDNQKAHIEMVNKAKVLDFFQDNIFLYDEVSLFSCTLSQEYSYNGNSYNLFWDESEENWYLGGIRIDSNMQLPYYLNNCNRIECYGKEEIISGEKLVEIMDLMINEAGGFRFSYQIDESNKYEIYKCELVYMLVCKDDKAYLYPAIAIYISNIGVLHFDIHTGLLIGG